MRHVTCLMGFALAASLVTLAPAESGQPRKPPTPEAELSNRGFQHLQEDELDQALAAFAELIERYPHDHRGYAGRGRVFDRKGDYRQAIADYSEVIARVKGTAQKGSLLHGATLRRGVMYRELGAYAESLADFTTLIAKDRGDDFARRERARTLMKLDRPGEALQDIDVALWLMPSRTFHVTRAEILAALGRESEAKLAMAEATKPTSSEAKQDTKKMGPAMIRRRYMPEASCPEDDRHELTVTLEDGRVSVAPSYGGAAGSIGVGQQEGRLWFAMGAQPCRIHIALAKGDLPTDAPPAVDAAMSRTIARGATTEPIVQVFYPEPATGCTTGTYTIRVYWGLVEFRYWPTPPSEDHMQRARFSAIWRGIGLHIGFGDPSCRITAQLRPGA
jgi:tetratricopeptide (TPR) repeat protein